MQQEIPTFINRSHHAVRDPALHQIIHTFQQEIPKIKNKIYRISNRSYKCLKIQNDDSKSVKKRTGYIHPALRETNPDFYSGSMD